MTTPVLLHLIFGLGGGLGAVARHGLSLAILHRLPVATLVINVVGCFALGLGLGSLSGIGGALGADLRQLIFGFCGGFTTYSSFAYQTLDLHRKETVLHAAGNILFSLVACLGALWFGRALGAAMIG